MLIALIRKDDATEVPRQVVDIEAARALATADMPVFILEGGVKIPVDEYGKPPAEEEEAAPAEASSPAPTPAAKTTAAKAAAPKKTAARKR